MATTFSKLLLSQSTNGKQIPVSITGSPGTTLHTVSSDTSTVDEIWVYASNTNTNYVTASLYWGNTGSIDTTQVLLPPFSRTLIADGRLLGSSLSVNAASSGGTASFDGFVNRITVVSSTDEIVQQWNNRVLINGGSQPSASTLAALTTFVNTLSSNGLLNSMYCVNCFVPESLIATCTPLITIAGNHLFTNNNFVASDLTTHGLKGDASTKFLDTGFQGTSFFTDNNAGMTMYCSQTASAGQYDNGYTSNSGDKSFVTTTHWNGTPTFMGQVWQNSVTDLVSGSSTIISPTTGSYLSVNRLSSTDLKLYTANSQTPHTVVFSNTGTRTGVRQGQNIYIFAIHAFDSGALPFGHTNSRISFFALHAGLTQAQSILFFNAIQTLRQNLGGGYV